MKKVSRKTATPSTLNIWNFWTNQIFGTAGAVAMLRILNLASWMTKTLLISTTPRPTMTTFYEGALRLIQGRR